ncbi:Meiosis-specific serine/threonine-protein kinase mek1 [Puccinia graminis f. sp. tritici]|uniref:Meiosis-specific serine/threonine-protein kinase mek1 n=1 Tax=Puccinia graminis f. sp. tritici TaxID=56615 RepID=A0A5B0MCF0_PUCGR|nr:Meiosis-specific serine/threonine-protein kinase mek1 [Puccinia graminis f. sp. tritici]
MQRSGELLQSIPKRRKPVLIDHVDSSTNLKCPSQTNLSAKFLSQSSQRLEDALGSLGSSGNFKQLPGSFTSIRELTVSCVSKMSPTPPPQPEEAGRLLTTDNSGVTQILIIKLNEHPWSLGRNQQADLTIDKPTVSNWHCKLYADLSTNGIRYNDRLVRKKAVILNNGDQVEIAGQGIVQLCLLLFLNWFSCYDIGNFSFLLQTFLSTGARFYEHLGKYRITERVLGSGFFSVVHLAINQETGAQLACKIIKRQTGFRQSARETKKFQQVVQQEVKLNASLDHPNINKILGLKQAKENIYIFLELVTGGDLFGYVNRNKKLDENEAKFISYQLALALEYMHDQKQISHRDIKPENILLAHHGPDPRVLLADFGAARLADKAFCSMQGTMSYAAPEVLTVYTRPQGYDGKKADVWSLGVCVYTMICGFHPFDNSQLESAEAERREICKILKYNVEPSEVHFVKSVLKPASKDEAVKCMSGGGYKEVRELLKQMFESDPRRRISASEILNHPWITQSRNMLETKYKKHVLCQK